MSDDGDTEYNELLLVLSLPDMRGGDGELLDADRMANGLVQIINEEWMRNAEGRPDWFRPARIYLNPGPQWLDASGLARLLAAATVIPHGPPDADAPQEVVDAFHVVSMARVGWAMALDAYEEALQAAEDGEAS